MWPFGIVLRGMVSNHLMVPWLKTVVLSDEEKGIRLRCQAGNRKTNASEPLMKCRYLESGIRTRVTNAILG